MSFRDHHISPSTARHIVVEVTRGARRRRYRLSPAVVAAAGALLLLLGAATVGAAGYLLFHDELLAGLMERQRRAQYAYEDRIADLRLRLDQLASRQLVDQDGVEGKMQSLVLRQAQLETRAAVIARLVERTNLGDAGVTAIAQARRAPARDAGAGDAEARNAGAALAAPRRIDKPQPEGLELRLRDGVKPLPLPLPLSPSLPPHPAPGRDEAAGLGASSGDARAGLAEAGDPGAPLPLRLERVALSLDRVEREQARKLSDIVRPALAATARLRQAFDLAGLSVERFFAREASRRRKGASAVGGPFVAAPESAASGAFQQNLAVAESAVAALDGLRHALPMVPLRKPLAGPLQMTSAFGYRADPFLGRPALHGGVDLRDDYGAPVAATAAGTVTAAGPQGGYGNLVEIDHGGGLSTRYGHLSAIAVAPGQQVGPGTTVGRVGSTGRSTGPHLHYEVRVDGEPVDPARFLKAASALGGSERAIGAGEAD
jgi:murein DD-endopeptidase MepM/ murein hydrolase activator NlpD